MTVFAHPDDMEVHCGGTVRKLSSAGHRVIEVIMSKGNNGGDEEVREREALEGAKRLGVDRVEFLNHEDGRISVDPESIDAVRTLISKFEPDIVFTHSPNDTHQDHRRTFRIVTSAVSKFPEVTVLMGEGPSTVGFQPVVYVDVTDVLEEKLEAVKVHRSQVERGAISEEMVVKTAEFRGMEIGVRYAEAFEAFRISGSLLLG
ncbi:PIG-L deacetylase family protein [Methanopyrus sp.]